MHDKWHALAKLAAAIHAKVAVAGVHTAIDEPLHGPGAILVDPQKLMKLSFMTLDLDKHVLDKPAKVRHVPHG